MLEKILSKEVIAPIVIAVSFFVIYKILSRIVKKIAAIKMGHVNDKRKKTIISLINNIIKYRNLISKCPSEEWRDTMKVRLDNWEKKNGRHI